MSNNSNSNNSMCLSQAWSTTQPLTPNKHLTIHSDSDITYLMTCDIHRSDFGVSEERRLASECQSVPDIGHCVDCIRSLLCDVFSLLHFCFSATVSIGFVSMELWNIFLLTVNIIMWCYTFMWVTGILVIMPVFDLFKQFFVTCL